MNRGFDFLKTVYFDERKYEQIMTPSMVWRGLRVVDHSGKATKPTGCLVEALKSIHLSHKSSRVAFIRRSMGIVAQGVVPLWLSTVEAEVPYQTSSNLNSSQTGSSLDPSLSSSLRQLQI